MPQIKVAISPSGQPIITTDGFVGDSCLKATEALESKLSGSAEGVEIRDYNGGIVATEGEVSY